MNSATELTSDPLLRAEDITVHFTSRRRTVHAVDQVSFEIRPGETLGLVGESGCGKSSVARALLQAPPPSSGRVLFGDVDLTDLRGEALRQQRRKLQMIYQDPIASLNPRRTIANIVAEPLEIWEVGTRDEREARVAQMLTAVGLEHAEVATRRPHELSGGQCQRVNIARALVLDPELLICDEPVAALDVSIQAQILNLLEDAKQRYGLSMLFISHDLAVVKNLSDRVAVIYLGRLCEIGSAETVFSRPAHHYTSALVAAVPSLGRDAAGTPKRSHLIGEPPSPVDPPSGCRFRTRCPRADERCALETPQLRPYSDGRWVACHHPDERAALNLRQDVES